MEIKIINSNKNFMRFLIKEADKSVVNSLRRIIIGELPTLAIEKVSFIDNTSSLYDEVIAHRIGLIPIKAAKKGMLDALSFKESCSCKDEGCASCEVNFYLKKQGPCTVYSHELEPEGKGFEAVEEIPIVKLGTGQNIELKATAQLGKGKNHAKWQPAVVGYTYYPSISISKGCDGCKDCAKACPRNVFDIVEKKGEEPRIVPKRAIDCILCNACVEVCESNAISVKGDETSFVFFIESTGAMEPEEIFLKACSMLKDKVAEMASEL